MVDRHIRTKQRPPSIKTIITRLEAKLEVEETTKGKEDIQRYIDYWKDYKKKEDN